MRVGLIAYNWEADTSLALMNLIAYAQQTEEIRKGYSFEQYCAATPKTAMNEEVELFKLLQWVRDHKFEIVGFSCYIWNIKFVNRAAQAIKELWPNMLVVYGGQQIRGFYIQQVFERERCVDICVLNEGEITFKNLLLALLSEQPDISQVKGLAFLQNIDRPAEFFRFSGGNGAIEGNFSFVQTGDGERVETLDEIPSPYLGAQSLPVGGAFLYEASRGCPYRCAFCIWGEAKGVREYPMERVEAELRQILAHKPSHIMFCDGTFNMRRERAGEILKILISHLRDGLVLPFSLLLELKLELVDDDLAAILDELVRLNPLVTIEFGLQSASPEAAELMHRPFNESRFRAAWGRLSPKLRSSAIIDTIYGLPGDGIEQFMRTVDFCYSLAPHRIQCFRLAILPGSEFERQSENHELQYSREPNHMVYRTKWVDLDDMMWLETFGFAVADLYHFHGNSIKAALTIAKGPTFSELTKQFVTWAGRARIIESSYAGNRPEGRWRAINLSPLFQEYLLTVLLPTLSVSKHVIDKFNSLLEYEIALGKIAVEGVQTRWISDGRSGGVNTKLGVAAHIIQSNFDVPSFLISARGRQDLDITDLQSTKSYVAMTMRAGHQDVKIPVSYKISSDLAKTLMDIEPLERIWSAHDDKSQEKKKKLQDIGLVVTG